MTNDDREITTPKAILEQGKMFYNNSKYKQFFQDPNLHELDETEKK